MEANQKLFACTTIKYDKIRWNYSGTLKKTVGLMQFKAAVCVVYVVKME